jgi:phosphate transport system substrate-binding protein
VLIGSEIRRRLASMFGMVTVATLLLVLTGTAASAGAADIRIGGEIDACNGFFAVVKEQFKDDTGINLEIRPNSSTNALIDLDSGYLDIATTDFTLDNLITTTEKRGYTVFPENFQTQGIGTNTILVFLDKSNIIKELTQKQLSDIFTGKVTNWKQVGGINQKIIVIWGEETPGQNQLYAKYVIGSKPVVKTAVKVANQRDIINKIIQTPGSIGIASHVFTSARTRNPKTPFVSSKVIAITKGAPNQETQKLLELVKSYDF